MRTIYEAEDVYQAGLRDGFIQGCEHIIQRLYEKDKNRTQTARRIIRTIQLKTGGSNAS